MGFDLPPETYNFLSVLMGFVVFLWTCRLVEKFSKLILLREAMRDNRVSFLPALGSDLVEFEFCTEAHFRALGMIQQDAPPIHCPQIVTPFNMKDGSIEIEFSDDNLLIKFNFESSVSCSIQLVFGLKKEVLMRHKGKVDDQVSNCEEESTVFEEENGIEMSSMSGEGSELEDKATTIKELNWDDCAAISSPFMFDAGENSFEHNQKLNSTQMTRLTLKNDDIFVAIIFQRVDLSEGVSDESLPSKVMSLLGHQRSLFNKGSFIYSPASITDDNSNDSSLGDILGLNFMDIEKDEKPETLVKIIIIIKHLLKVFCVLILTFSLGEFDVFSGSCYKGITTPSS